MQTTHTKILKNGKTKIRTIQVLFGFDGVSALP